MDQLPPPLQRNWIDLNCDMAELDELESSGVQAEIMKWVTSINISCGAHAGNDALIIKTLQRAKKLQLAIGAHPGYPDRIHFGRNPMKITNDELRSTISSQLFHLRSLCDHETIKLQWIKLHGALYNEAADSETVCGVIADVLDKFDKNLIVVTRAGSFSCDHFRHRGYRVIEEAFIDRAYTETGALASRSLPNSVLQNIDDILKQSQSIAIDSYVETLSKKKIPIKAQTLCVHSDTPSAAEIARTVRRHLSQKGIAVKPFSLGK